MIEEHCETCHELAAYCQCEAACCRCATTYPVSRDCPACGCCDCIYCAACCEAQGLSPYGE